MNEAHFGHTLRVARFALERYDELQQHRRGGAAEVLPADLPERLRWETIAARVDASWSRHR